MNRSSTSTDRAFENESGIDSKDRLVRIVWTPAIIGICSFFGVLFYGAAGYVKPVGEWYECWTLVAVYYLIIHYARANEPDGVHPFNKLPNIAATYNLNLSRLYVSASLEILISKC